MHLSVMAGHHHHGKCQCQCAFLNLFSDFEEDGCIIKKVNLKLLLFFPNKLALLDKGL